MSKNDFNIVTYGDSDQDSRRLEIVKLLKECPIPDSELLLNLGLFLVPQTLSRILFLNFLYQKILDLQGVIFDFGTRWGQNASVFTSLRGIYEPFNRLRKVACFDTFEGFNGVDHADGKSRMMETGSYSVSDNYKEYIEALLAKQEAESPLNHIKKHEVVQGDGPAKLKEYLESNPETIVALAYFDFDLYKPTKEAILTIKDRLTKGSVLAFDELNDHDCPGETLAVKETLGLTKYAFKRFRYNSRTSYVVIE